MPYGPSVPSEEQLLAYFTHFDFLSDLSTCVDGLLWLELLSSWAPEVENQFLFINPGLAGRVILEFQSLVHVFFHGSFFIISRYFTKKCGFEFK